MTGLRNLLQRTIGFVHTQKTAMCTQLPKAFLQIVCYFDILKCRDCLKSAAFSENPDTNYIPKTAVPANAERLIKAIRYDKKESMQIKSYIGEWY